MELLSFKKFNEQEAAEAVARLLHEHKIIFEITEDAAHLDAMYGNSELHNYYHVKIQGSDFVKAKIILLNETQAQVEQIDRDHYLFQFTNVELLDVIYKSDEWSEFDYLLARRILKERGKAVPEETIKSLSENRKMELAKPNELEIHLSYAKSLLGIFGVLMAWSIIRDMKTLPDGQRVYTYSKNTREKAQLLFFVSLLITFIWFLGIVGIIKLTGSSSPYGGFMF